MRLFKRGKVFWLELVHDGQRIQRSTKATNRKLASEVASAFHTSLIRDGAGILERRKTPLFPEAMQEFLAWSAAEHKAHPSTARRHATSSKPLLSFFGKVDIRTITPDDVEAYKRERAKDRVTLRTGKVLDRNIRPASINRELACLRQMFNQQRNAHPQLTNPVSKVRFLAEDNEQDRVLSFTEQRAYLAKATPVLADVFNLILQLGCRPEEIYRLEASHVDWSADSCESFAVRPRRRGGAWSSPHWRKRFWPDVWTAKLTDISSRVRVASRERLSSQSRKWRTRTPAPSRSPVYAHFRSTWHATLSRHGWLRPE